MKNIAQITMSFAAGAVLGGLAGILMAPASGSKTRKKIMRETKKLQNNVNDGLKKTAHNLEEAYHNQLRKLTTTNAH